MTPVVVDVLANKMIRPGDLTIMPASLLFIVIGFGCCYFTEN